jgi:flagellar biosynthesis/type III secretory pathway protein FliH
MLDDFKTATEADAYQKGQEKGFYEGYHRGLKEGYAVARFPERCHCSHCRSHGEWCKLSC